MNYESHPLFERAKICTKDHLEVQSSLQDFKAFWFPHDSELRLLFAHDQVEKSDTGAAFVFHFMFEERPEAISEINIHEIGSIVLPEGWSWSESVAIRISEEKSKENEE